MASFNIGLLPAGRRPAPTSDEIVGGVLEETFRTLNGWLRDKLQTPEVSPEARQPTVERPRQAGILAGLTDTKISVLAIGFLVVVAAIASKRF